MSRLGLTGFQTTFGTVSIIEIAKAFGGSETNVEPFFTEIKKVLQIAAIGAPAGMPGLFQQGQCDVMYTNTQTVGTLRGQGVDIEFTLRSPAPSPSSRRCISPRAPQSRRTPTSISTR